MLRQRSVSSYFLTETESDKILLAVRPFRRFPLPLASKERKSRNVPHNGVLGKQISDEVSVRAHVHAYNQQGIRPSSERRMSHASSITAISFPRLDAPRDDARETMSDTPPTYLQNRRRAVQLTTQVKCRAASQCTYMYCSYFQLHSVAFDATLRHVRWASIDINGPYVPG